MKVLESGLNNSTHLILLPCGFK